MKRDYRWQSFTGDQKVAMVEAAREKRVVDDPDAKAYHSAVHNKNNEQRRLKARRDRAARAILALRAQRKAQQCPSDQ